MRPEDEILDQITAILSDLIQSGEEISDELLALLEDLIQGFIQERSAAEAPVSLPEVSQSPYPSSNIFGFKYDPKSQKMLVKFMGKDVADGGPIYSYDGVPENVFNIIRRGAVAPRTSGKNKYHEWFKGKTPSHGASVYALLKEGGFPYQKVA